MKKSWKAEWEKSWKNNWERNLGRHWHSGRKRGRKTNGGGGGAVILLIALMLSTSTFADPLFTAAAGGKSFIFLDEDGREGGSGSEAFDAAAGRNGERPFAPGTPSSALPSTPGNALLSRHSVSSLGDLWDEWNGDFSFLDGNSGDGSKKKPYQIRNKSQLMGLSQLAAMGMRVEPGEGGEEIIGSYEGKYFKLMSSMDLGGMSWNPIGFYRDTTEMDGEIEHKFCGHFDGNGKTVSNFRLGQRSWSNVGLFGSLEDAVVENLTIRPNKTVYGKNNVAILAGNSSHSSIRNCVVAGDISASGNAGGITAELIGSGRGGLDSVIENCEADITADADNGGEVYVGGIAGKAAGSSIVDCRVATGDNRTSRLQGKGIVGGIAGFQNDTDLYNCYVSGTIGGVGTQAAGGLTGRYGSGRMKVARFEGAIGDSGLGSAGHRGTFIGTREAGDYFRYGEDLAYLFADTEAGIAYNVCGSGISDDNEYTYAAHVGYSHAGDLHYSLVQGGKSKDITERYYYEELEEGILRVMEEDDGGADAGELGYTIDHIAPNDVGRPTRGYLVIVPQIDTISSGTNYYDVAALEVRGNSSYCGVIDKERRGAVAPGKSVTITTAPRNTEEAKFQMEGVPTYTKGGAEHSASYVKGGEYTFTMPAENTEVKAGYKKVAVKVSAVPEAYQIQVVEERTGNRKNPVKTTKVFDKEGKLIATYINGSLEHGTRVQPVLIGALVDRNNDVADSSVRWSVDDPELILLEKNDDEDEGGYTGKSASVRVNLDAAFFTEIIRRLEKEQAGQNYRYPLPDTIYGAGHQSGGVAVLTAATRPAASFEGRPCTGNCRLNVTFQIRDKTYVANEGASLDKAGLEFTVTRSLTGDRRSPEEHIRVTPPQPLSAAFFPDFFDRKDIAWRADDNSLIEVNGENGSARVAARADAKWIRDIIAADAGRHSNDPYAPLDGNGRRTAKATVLADDMLGNRQTAECQISIRFVTDDQTKVYVEEIHTFPGKLSYELICTRRGPRTGPTISWSGAESKEITAELLPEPALNKNVRWQVSDDALTVDGGVITVNTGAEWIREADKNYPYRGKHTSLVTAITEDGGLRAETAVELSYQRNDEMYITGGFSHGGGNGGGGGGGKGGIGGGNGPSSGAGPSGGVGPGAAAAAPAGSITGIWVNTADGLWTFTSGGRTYASEWAYIHNPYAAKAQDSTDWFRFDAAGHMVTGWFADIDGNLYYLSPSADGTQGRMSVGWQWITGADGRERRYYFNPISDGTRGALYRNCTTPDGMTVNEKGEWTVDGAVQSRDKSAL